MKKALKGTLAGCTLVLLLVVLGTVIGGDVTIQEGTIQGQVFKSTGCTATGTKAIAFGHVTTASGDYSTAMGYNTTASGDYSIATGMGTTASANYSTALGKNSNNSVLSSLTVGFGDRVGGPRVEFRVEDELVTVYNDLFVTCDVDANTYSEHSAFYDKDTYGTALDYLEDCSNTIKVNGEGMREYDHERDPVFLKKSVSVKDYDKYTDEYVWNEELQEYEPVRTYETHQELRSSLSMKVAWLRQCVFELKQENELLRGELAQIKQKLNME
ncbi:MAG: hypothetical protein KAY65_06870 [Planctomycetes bacterium]|nr:hypothetical protein [Planctomycetota bacterium]